MQEQHGAPRTALHVVTEEGAGRESRAGLEGTWRNYNGKKYFIVLNSTDQPLANQVIQLRGVGAATSATVASESRAVSISNSSISDEPCQGLPLKQDLSCSARRATSEDWLIGSLGHGFTDSVTH